MKTTKEQRNELRQLLAKTSQGEWKTVKGKHGIHADKMSTVNVGRYEVVGIRQLAHANVKEVEENAAFIAAVHNVLADLLDDLDELTQDKAVATIN